jgi:hypothetical protein
MQYLIDILMIAGGAVAGGAFAAYRLKGSASFMQAVRAVIAPQAGGGGGPRPVK